MSRAITRRNFLKNSAIASMGIALSYPLRIEARPRFDLIIKDGMVLDGTGSSAWSADLGIAGDTITAIGSIQPEQGKKVLEVKGLQVCPGFIDIHTHSDGIILAYPGADSRVRQGITTEIAGNCGDSAAPLSGIDAEQRRKDWREKSEVEADWTDVASYLDLLEKTGIAINQALLIGHGTLRQNAIGLVDRPFSPQEMKQILYALEEGLEQGAVGLSTGLEYAPGIYAPTSEIVELACLVARHDGLYASHIRDEEQLLLEAVNEALEIGRQAGVRVEISHLKASGRPNWNKQNAALALLEDGRQKGINVLADAYPYTAFSTGLTILLGSWVREGGSAAIVQHLQNSTERARIRKEVAERIEKDLGSFDLMVISRVQTERNRQLIGKNLKEIGEIWGIEPVDAMLRLLEEEEASVSFIGHGMSEENVERVLSHPLVMIGSDGWSMAPTGKAAESRPHPRSYGAFARILGYYVREKKLFDLPTAIKKMTSMPASQSGISDRGRIAVGMKADLVVFNAQTIKDEATFESPHRFASGIDHVLVNGIPVLEKGEPTGARPGRALRKT
jgi:N-acyl-D-amino-acid deacylase